ncbi:hypothetical protein [Microcoleus sp. bin38.metabat.b11b12b14.051]|uniref:hypothetical protein n=1 Tax=Microcoleus sp. bin38.metabat.b11b12b14.051 TaxID=2742709 RepID=UPI0025D84F23|nr:hypothetical protein [Microcoleus sp. bin38.metabat.b11b12b14.051]
MNEQQTQILLSSIVQLISKISVALVNCDSRLKALENQESQESAAAFLQLNPLIEALQQQVNSVVP